MLRAIARAWNWRRQMETGAASTIQDIATAEKAGPRHLAFAPRAGFVYVNGELDDVPEQAFLNVGGVEQVLAKAKMLQAESGQGSTN